MKRFVPALVAVLFCGGLFFGQDQSFLRVSVSQSTSLHRILIESSFPIQPELQKSGNVLQVRIRSEAGVSLRKNAFENAFIRAVGWKQETGVSILTVETAGSAFSYDTFSIDNPPQYFINIRPEGNFSSDRPAVISGREKESPEPGEPRRTVPQGIRTIVIDPGHGGLEAGAKSAEGTLEKDIVLEISRKLKKIIETQFAFHVELTRDKDVEVSLEDRAATANNLNAFLFLSIHTNSSFRKNARGPETYYLSMNAPDKEARRLAYFENTATELDESDSSNETDEIQLILWDMAQSAYLQQSSRLAEKIQAELNLLFRTRDRGVKQNKFYVLAGVACPAVLIEVAFLSFPDDEKKLLSSDFQDRVAQAIYKGLFNYIRDYQE
ncbi:MAG: N-acetylmuramoyl-L-alanine amidase [Acidobacteriota bacterium]